MNNPIPFRDIFYANAVALVALSLLVMPVVAEPSIDPPDAATNPLRVCAHPSAMPRTGRTSDGAAEGVDLAVAKWIASQLNRPLEVHWCPGGNCPWRSLQDNKCDMVVGRPHESNTSSQVAWAAPYAASQFGLVARSDDPSFTSIADLQGKRVGVVTGTVPLDETEHTVVPFKTRDALLDHFLASQLDGALVDVDYTAWYLKKHPDSGLRLVSEFVPTQRWNMAIAVRASDQTLLSDINQVLAKGLREAKLAPRFAKFGLTYRPPLLEIDEPTVVDDAWKRIQKLGELRLSMDPANLPYSSADPEQPGFDVELAQALAKQLGVKLQLEWIDVHRETAIGALLEGESDLAFGAAIEPEAIEDEQALTGKVIYSRPYYGTGYMLVAGRDAPAISTLSDLQGKASQRLATEAGSVADYQLRQRGYRRRLFRTQLAVLQSIQDKHVDYGYLWANVGWTLHTTPELKVNLVDGYQPEDHWNISIAIRRGQKELKRRVDEALTKLVEEGTVKATVQKYHVPHFPPFEQEACCKEADDQQTGSTLVPREATPPRDSPPRMSRRQRSKRPYSGLERILAKGRLVVGLDQNNLPFSTAHPEPAGLDYEIASLLAEELGVELEIYWAYSSHDSYPSKLTSRKLCDVILGVMPDDRFAERVLYTDPYYVADYRLVVAADDNLQEGQLNSANGPIAVEPGVAVRGLDGVQVKRYPNSKAILSAVAQHKVKAGYVISTRGAWLAHKLWPGDLKMVPISKPADRFPICVAVRISDEHLKASLNKVLKKLATTGQLAEVFSRWHIPYLSTERELTSNDYSLLQ